MIQETHYLNLRNWIKINDESGGTYNVSNQIKLNNSMIRSNVCDYSDKYTHVKGTITGININLQS